MIRDAELLRRFEDEEIRREPVGYHHNVELFRAMLKQAVARGAVPVEDWRSDIETDIRVIQTINQLRVR